MSGASSYDEQVRVIQANNLPILKEFQTCLKQSGLSEKTIGKHMSNIELFAMYLMYYDPLRQLDKADGGDAWSFITSWFPRKVWDNIALQ